MAKDPFDIVDANPDALERVRKLCNELAAAASLIEQREDALKELKKEYNALRQKKLPDEMAEAGINSLTLEDGHVVSVKTFVSGGLPKDPVERENAIAWLEDHEGGGLVKTAINMAFSKEEKELADHCAELLRNNGYDVEEKFDVHPASLGSFVKERLESGLPVDQDVLGIYVGKIAEVKMPRKRKGK